MNFHVQESYDTEPTELLFVRKYLLYLLEMNQRTRRILFLK